MHGLVVGHFQTVRGYHAVKSQFLRQTVIQVAVRLLLRIDLLGQYRLCVRLLLTSVVLFSNGHIFLCMDSYDAHSKGKHHDYFSHITLDLVVNKIFDWLFS